MIRQENAFETNSGKKSVTEPTPTLAYTRKGKGKAIPVRGREGP
jgi:hypothetical protein